MKRPQKHIVCISYWIILSTWGCVMTVIGMISLAILKLSGHKIRRNLFGFLVEVGENWGGVSLGPVAIVGSYSRIDPYYLHYVRRHEFGHSVQLLMWGPLFPFVISIPSAIRYWFFRLQSSNKYDDYGNVWFERHATEFGYAWFEKFE